MNQRSGGIKSKVKAIAVKFLKPPVVLLSIIVFLGISGVLGPLPLFYGGATFLDQCLSWFDTGNWQPVTLVQTLYENGLISREWAMYPNSLIGFQSILSWFSGPWVLIICSLPGTAFFFGAIGLWKEVWKDVFSFK